MGLWSRIKDAFSNKAGNISEKRTDFGAQGYRPVNYNDKNNRNNNFYNRDLTPWKHDRMQTICLEMWKRSPVARRVIELRKNLIISEGFQFIPQGPRKGKNKRLEKYWQTLWETNCWPEKIDERIQDLLIYGELFFYCPSVNPYNGKVKMTQFNPQNVDSIQQDLFNIEDLDKIILKDAVPVKRKVNGAWTDPKDQKEFDIIRDTGDGELGGEVFYLPFNKTSFATRGLSDIAHVIDWLDIHSKILETECERIEFTKAYIYKCGVMGGQDAVERSAERHQKPPQPGSTLFYSKEMEDWDLISPQMTLFDTVGFERYILLLILGGMGIPEHWFVEAGSINKATSANMDEPIFAWARKAKFALCNFFKLMFKYCVQEARKDFGPLADFSDEDCKFDIISRDPDRGAYDEIGAMLKSIGDSMNMYVASNWMTNENAGMIARNIMESLGLGTISEPEQGDNLNVGLISAKAKEQEYENLQKLEGMTNLVSRLFSKDFSNKLEGETKNQEADAAGKFLGNAIRSEFEKARRRSENERAAAEAAKQAQEQAAEQAEQQRNGDGDEPGDGNGNGSPAGGKGAKASKPPGALPGKSGSGKPSKSPRGARPSTDSK